MTKDEALQMCLEYIETDKHERKYVRHAIKAALAQPVQEQKPCIGKDPRCPCQDGAACHYKDCGNTKAWPVPQAESVGEVVEVNNDGFRCEFSQRLAVGTKLYTAPPEAQPEQEPVACRFCHSKKGCWTWQCYHCGEIDDVQQPPPLPKQEPVAWEHHEYRPYGAPGEIRIHAILASQYMMPDGSVAGDFQWLVDQYRADKNTIKLIPLYTTPPAGRTALLQIDDPDRRALQAEGKHPAPCARHCEAKAFEIEIRSLNSRLKQAQPVQEPVAWTTMPEATDWDFVSGSKDPTGKLDGKWFPLYTAPPAAQRPWVGLTEDEIKIAWAQLWYDLNHGKLSAPDAEVRNNVVVFGQALEAMLKEQNT